MYIDNSAKFNLVQQDGVDRGNSAPVGKYDQYGKYDMKDCLVGGDWNTFDCSI